jgi:SAM-dependent methyltransferase
MKAKLLRKVYRKAMGPSYAFCLKEKLKGYQSILDLGCGKNSPLRLFHANFYLVGVEMFKPYILNSKEAQIHDDYVLADLRQLGIRSKSFDTCIALDVLEHLTKADGLRLINNMERIGRGNVIVFTPNKFLPQHECDENVLQIHRSGWTVKEFQDMGYHVKGINGLKFLRKEETKIRFRPKRLFIIISDLSQKLTYHFPNIAYQLLCVKELINKTVQAC